MNAVLSENNPSLTFVTAFVGCLRIPTGELVYCNAGHCAPLIYSPITGNPSPLPLNPNIPLGFDGHYSFVEQGCMLGEGETLVLYTDGVTEARNPEREMLGMKRWAEIVKTGDGLPVTGNGLEGHLWSELKAFMGKAEPTDDITLMTIRKTGPVIPVTIHVPCREDQWPVMKGTIHSFGLCAGLDKKALKKFEVAAEEAIVNILHYSQASEVELKMKNEKLKIILTLTDDGIAFDPTAHVPNEKATDERQVGGMGIHLIRQIVDEIRYERSENKNILTLVKSHNP